jgi:hypothetical protein
MPLPRSSDTEDKMGRACIRTTASPDKPLPVKYIPVPPYTIFISSIRLEMRFDFADPLCCNRSPSPSFWRCRFVFPVQDDSSNPIWNPNLRDAALGDLPFAALVLCALSESRENGSIIFCSPFCEQRVRRIADPRSRELAARSTLQNGGPQCFFWTFKEMA